MTALRTLFVTVGAGALAVGLAAGSSLAQDPTQITVRFVHVNDVDRMDADGDGAGGIAKIAAVHAMAEAEFGDPVLFTFGGDMISPSLMSSFDKGAHMVDLFNRIGVQYAALGNHEFDFGPDVLLERIAEAEFTILATNVRLNGEPLPGTVDTAIVEMGDLRIGMFGLTTPDTVDIASPGPDMEFLDPVETAAAAAASLKEQGAHVVIGLSHVDLDEELAALQASSDLTFILSGHNHQIQAFYDGINGMLESTSQGEHVAILDLAVTLTPQDDGTTAVDWVPEVRFVSTIDVDPNPDAAAAVKVYIDHLDAALNIEIGTTETELDSRRATVRSTEASIGNLIADAMRAAVGSDVAITNGGGIRADRIYPAGTVLTRRDILSELPFGNVTVLLQVDGATIREALESGVSRIEDGAGRFPQVSGLSFAFDPSAPAGSRVSEVMVGDEPLFDTNTYTLATNDYMAAGGDGYSAFIGAPTLIDAAAGTLMATQVIDYISAAGTVAPATEGRIRQ
ncbi:MAG: bifunctional metallophosphatase/5'-nucleotidase [Alphaproteobacteria bacterium]